ncbi:MAG: rhodanese-like domain-containing protein [Desulfuromonadaceae bacterium]|nr:rhodanese-like domain-containing protein [Desulfuromonadaceae bacterium]
MAGDFQALDQVLEQMDIDFVGQGKHKITVEKLFSASQASLLDIRTPEEQACLPLLFPGQVKSVHIPLSELPVRREEIDPHAVVGIFCPHGVRAAMAYTYLCAQGYTGVRVLEGGYAAITEMARPGMVLAQLIKRG